MRKKYSRTNIPIRHVIIAWQPTCIERREGSAEPGRVAVFHKGDLGELPYLMTHGAGWFYWKDETVDELVRRLVRLKREIARDYGIPKWRTEGMFRRIREYRLYRVEQRRCREERKVAKRLISVRTR
ncbi:hypothetical protein [Rhizorhapis suberifaciens]|uniref:Uncharacterized protein n=1 Tax=Rhizorhapis suberifaciens TaxID=13656 RepID=A0A840HVN7_9SPHN|nr:hypothetical protein [Rhizorhapis suberifaciens]MBB4641484.1 hypothetical protein [Rhizorhapis suberifaciens]